MIYFKLLTNHYTCKKCGSTFNYKNYLKFYFSHGMTCKGKE